MMLRSSVLGIVLGIAGLAQQLTLTDVEAALQKEPNNPRLWAARGVLLERSGDLPNSLNSFQRALAISPKFAPALMGATEVAYRTHDQRVQDYVERLLALEPNEPTAHAIAGELAFEAHQCAAAVEHFAQAGPALQVNRAALERQGACLIGLNRVHQAVPVFERVAKLSPSDQASLYNVALALQLDGQNQASLGVLRQMGGLESSNPDVLNLLGSVEEALHHTPEAVAALRRATELAPADEKNYLDLALLCLDHNSMDLAVEIVDAGLGNVPGSARLHTMRGSIYAQAGKLELAQREFETASRLQPGSLYGTVGMSVLLRQTSDYTQAISLLENKLQSAPRDAVLHYLLGDALLGNGAEPGSAEFTRAREALETAVRLKPDFAQAFADLGKVYYRSGANAKAIVALRRAIQINPIDQPALNQLVMVLSREGRKREAAEIAETLRSQLDRQRREEVGRNRVRLSKTGH